MALEIYCDGACSGNHQKFTTRRSGIGIVFIEDNEVIHTVSENANDAIYPEITNNRAELYGIYRSLSIFDEDCEGFKTVAIFCDSKYSIDVFNHWLQGWKERGRDYKNKDIIDKIDALLQKIRGKGIEVSINHVYGHSTNEYNNMADRLAVKGADTTCFA